MDATKIIKEYLSELGKIGGSRKSLRKRLRVGAMGKKGVDRQKQKKLKNQ